MVVYAALKAKPGVHDLCQLVVAVVVWVALVARLLVAPQRTLRPGRVQHARRWKRCRPVFCAAHPGVDVYWAVHLGVRCLHQRDQLWVLHGMAWYHTGQRKENETKRKQQKAPIVLTGERNRTAQSAWAGALVGGRGLHWLGLHGCISSSKRAGGVPEVLLHVQAC